MVQMVPTRKKERQFSMFDADDLKIWSTGGWLNGQPLQCKGIVHDSREVKPGDLYLAIIGETHDGHRFCESAIQQGASGLIVSRPMEGLEIPQLVVKDTRRALSELARRYRNSLTMSCIGITGSVGKTSVKEMAADMLSQTSMTARNRGNWNNDIGLPLSLLNMDPDSRFGVFEIGMNHPGELQPLCDILQPDYGIMTEIGPVHLEYFDSVEAIAQEKATLVRAIPRNGFMVLDPDTPWYDLCKAEASCQVLNVSMQGNGDLNGTVVDGDLVIAGEVYRMPLPGMHIKQNALKCIALALQLGVHPDQIRDALNAFEAPSMRWERSEIDGITFINDAYNANPVSMRASVDTYIQEPATGTRWLILGGMAELGVIEQEAHRAIGKFFKGLEAVGAQLIVVGELAKPLWEEAGGTWCEGPAEAAALLKEQAEVGDRVLLKASRGIGLEKVLHHFANCD